MAIHLIASDGEYSENIDAGSRNHFKDIYKARTLSLRDARSNSVQNEAVDHSEIAAFSASDLGRNLGDNDIEL